MPADDASQGFASSIYTACTPDKKRRHQPQMAPTFSPCTPPPKRDAQRALLQPSMITVLVNRVDLFDSGCLKNPMSINSSHGDDETSQQHTGSYSVPGAPCSDVDVYRYESPKPSHQEGKHNNTDMHHGYVAILRVPHQPTTSQMDPHNPWMSIPVLDKSIPCPYDQELAKYWAQRRRLFRLFDHGIELDDSGWFSVTPEQIADHTAIRVRELFDRHGQSSSPNQPIVILDAFCGCGGNAIAFAKLIPNAIVVAVEVNRSKLLMAAKNASIYGIPSNKIVFCECDALFVLEHCYKNGQFVLDEPLTTPEAAMALMAAMPPPVETQTCVGGYQLGGIDVLPRNVNAVYMDPPWGGVDYNVFGRNGYDLAKNMWIKRSAPCVAVQKTDGSLDDGFFDTFLVAPRNKEERKAHFNCDMDISNSINGMELLKLAAAASDTRFVVYDVPRNVNRSSLGSAALAAGYRGNCKLEENYLNGRLKTVTAYFGSDWSSLVKADSM